MEIVVLLVFLSIVWVVGAVLFLGWQMCKGTHMHSDRLAILPLDAWAEAEYDHGGE